MLFFQLFIFNIIVLSVIAWAALFQRGRYFVPIVIGLIARLLLIFVHEYTRFFGEMDLSDYEPDFQGFVDNRQLGKPNWGVHVPAYVVLYPGWLYYFFGNKGIWLIRVVNAAVSLFVMAPLILIHKRIFGKEMSSKIALLVVLWPSWLRYGIEAGRSAAVAFFVLYALRYWLEFVERPSLKALILSIAVSLYAIILRVHHIAYFMPVGVYFLYERLKQIRSKHLKLVVFPLAILFMIFVVLGSVSFYRSAISWRGFDIRSMQQLVMFTQIRETGGSAYLRGIYPSSMGGLIWYLPLQAFYFMFSPMPWDAGKPFVIGSSIQAWILLIIVWRSIRYNWQFYKRNRPLKIIMLCLLFVIVGWGAVSKNAGAVERQRLPITLALLSIVPVLARRPDEEEPISPEPILRAN